MNTLCSRACSWLDNHFEPFIMIAAYASLTIIVATEVVRRFFFGAQTTWGAELSIHLFVWLTWFGASWGVKNGTHLTFSALRQLLPPYMQLMLYLFDNFLWLVLGVVVLYGAQKMITMQFTFGSVIQGSTIPMWWSFSIVPLAWALIYVRAIQNCFRCVRRYRCGMPLASSTGLRTS